MVYSDPYDPDGSNRTYECRSCGHRTQTAEPIGYCPVCQGAVMNISVARE
ncbi:rubrerythrin-like domain-containing protein [Halobacteria archaeon AArc-dxtr1]|nr:rubrerythrin-like domain-containing protein [Halobacteria archaeon AArc-dxtr1]